MLFYCSSMFSSNQQYIALRNRLYRQLDSYGLRKKGKENRSPFFKKTKSSESPLPEARPICHSNNLILQICLEASMPNNNSPQFLFNRPETPEKNIKNHSHIRAKSSRTNLFHSESTFLKRDRSLTTKNKILNNLSNQQHHEIRASTTISTRRRNQFIPPSIGIGIIAPKPILLQMNTFSRKKKPSPPSNKKHEALQNLNHKITQMWKHWNMKVERGRKLRKQNI